MAVALPHDEIMIENIVRLRMKAKEGKFPSATSEMPKGPTPNPRKLKASGLRVNGRVGS